ncbi:putative dTDP-D-glucose 4,6-dehydratase [Cavenderia fasciculata]|uniref:dTDP-D-glucose 4,6-dehydratase n=1 Tax=Cavenderia fasciculata TaxID=261658 RepID=F4Q5R7_CACFS|nr:putative dTDP-D-glucose 4,6-dehydratase [Cavenderia fasciculata]EGG17326.1 putative dTDP-D-glucose 4,6-dehydratase [Cavenderia fasciculata]|eukprot:XP_004355810.1 putative dTDP-D-glucose 4,6-dehydratase [Cavenderia fasciculata]
MQDIDFQPNEKEQKEVKEEEEYKPKNILLTGGAGFIGSHLTIHLCKKYIQSNARIIVLDKLDYCSSLKNLSEIEHYTNYRFYKGSILEKKLVKQILTDESIDTVIHLAAYSHVDASFKDSLKFTKNNIMGTHVLLDECRKYGGIQRFINVSTDEVYGSQPEQTDIDEQCNYRPTNPYSASKASAELLVLSFHQSFSFPIIITRCNNVYGPNQFPEKLIPKFINQLLNQNPCTIHGKGDNLRSFLFIDDVIKAFDIILHRAKIGENL